jgi:nitroimidazol reductase NimA-like FMN-containing flavoprotein (pyridoxamine 5'-phosphate oxidase superfamily)
MVAALTDQQIEHVLQSQIIGRIGCCTKNKMYVVPVTYVYHKGYIYAQSKEGLKIKIMRENPGICFQVDSLENMTNWRSVIVWGEYEELKGPKAQKAGMKILLDRLAPFMISETVRPSPGHSHPPEIVEKDLKAVAYRIKVIEKTGRYEKQ